MAEPKPPIADASTELAAERTMLAWIRTGLALMGFGFVVAKFGLFLRKLEALELGRVTPPLRGTSASLWVGIVLVILGVTVNGAAALRYRKHVEHLRRGEAMPPSSSALAYYLALVMAALGVGIALYLAKLPA